MKTMFVLSAVLLLSAAPLPSQAQVKVDMNQITCGDWLGYNALDREFVRYWLSGYYNAAGNNSVLDYKRVQKNSAKISQYCRKNKSQTLPTAIKNTAT